jgi:meso-butanediol dehydrogenase/(S,S)-butanediol dehydrogenase/diacetyl reductase
MMSGRVDGKGIVNTRAASGMSRASAARAFAPYHITGNASAPGEVDTPLWSELDADLVGTALFLACSDSDYVTGQVLMADDRGMVLV